MPSGLSTPSGLPQGKEASSSLWFGKTSARASRGLGLPGTAAVPLLCCLAPCPGGGAVGQASCRLRRRGRCPGAPRAGAWRDTDPAPPPSPALHPSSQVFSANEDSWRCGAHPQGRLRDWQQRHLGSRNLGGRFRGGGPPHFLRLPGRGRDFCAALKTGKEGLVVGQATPNPTSPFIWAAAAATLAFLQFLVL